MITLPQKKSLTALIVVGAALSFSAIAGPLPVQELPAELDRCGGFAPVNNEPYHWVQMDMDVSQIFSIHATAAGHMPGGNYSWSHTYIPVSFVAQKQTQYCDSFIDPAGFPHHISQARSCALSLSTQHVGGGNQQVVATLEYSGCYLKSSIRKPNKLLVDEHNFRE
ncbi:hypothetical protein [Microbulbifer rhizosphaerae]|uniref:Uncharacterized protein n=1 Tax=Microbulbifer rhizosphaerae TaxID=1562603 RepID=A0A7W4WC32_9GAMM|nr:hypothetical protein [Microbulbifer rhizosphaerae]MBB3060831.1 hypothetical protein [Microbulbifer rhizosphaerae]